MSSARVFTVLHIEDEPAHAEIVRRTFETNHFTNTLKHVGDGQSALDYLHRTGIFSDPASSPRPNLILLDLRLPRVDGLLVLKTIKSDPELKHIPVVILTTSASEEDISLAFDNNANSYLVKPVDFALFSDLLIQLGSYWTSYNCNPKSRDR